MYTYTTLSLGEVIYDRYPEALARKRMGWNETESEEIYRGEFALAMFDEGRFRNDPLSLVNEGGH